MEWDLLEEKIPINMESLLQELKDQLQNLEAQIEGRIYQQNYNLSYHERHIKLTALK